MDPQQQQQQVANLLGGMGMGAVLFIALFALAVAAFIVFLFWRVFSKAGLPGPLGLLVLVPGVGWIIAMCILAFSDWKLLPSRTPYASGVPAYPPPTYPPPGYPPSGTNQL